MDKTFDFVIIGSGFGGSVSALRLSEKGYRVLVLEKGKWFKPDDFPHNNWQLRKWLWAPILGWKGFFKMTFLNHITVLSGVGVGGGSLTYANTLPIPKKAFYASGSWKGLTNWKEELIPFYSLAYHMLGATPNPALGTADTYVKKLAHQIGREKHFEPAKVGVYFGDPGKTVDDPYFKGEGPDRTGCIHCGACMTGCKHNAKNSLDKNYLYLAQKKGAQILADSKVIDVVPIYEDDKQTGYQISYTTREGKKSKKEVFTEGVVFAGGVLGTVPLLLKLKESSLSQLSDQVGCQIRTNNEALVNVVSLNKEKGDFTKGIAIGSVLHTDEHSHLEPTIYGQGSGFFRTMLVPMAPGSGFFIRIGNLLKTIFLSPLSYLKLALTKDFSSRTSILLFMQTLDSTLRLKKGKMTPMKTIREHGPAPSAYIPEAASLANKYATMVDGKSMVSFAETLFGIPTTAHILGGAVMGKDIASGVIDRNNRVFGYKNMYVCDGSMISANPGVNPSLTITAIAERAMSKIPEKN
jgi:cholesterol oxidase